MNVSSVINKNSLLKDLQAMEPARADCRYATLMIPCNSSSGAYATEELALYSAGATATQIFAKPSVQPTAR
jgi:hypothetical protein